MRAERRAGPGRSRDRGPPSRGCRDSRQRERLRDLVRAQAESLLGEHERVEVPPERFVLEPFAHGGLSRLAQQVPAGIDRDTPLSAAAP